MNFHFGAVVADDPRYKEAIKRRAELHDELRRIQEELRALEDFIGLYERLVGSAGGQPRPENGRPRLRERNILPPRRLADLAREIILERGRPMTRSELVEAIESRGFPLAGKDKSKNLGTILWRFNDRFVNIEGRGYWPRDIPLRD